MNTIVSATTHEAGIGIRPISKFATILKGCWAAYAYWREDAAAIAELKAMSDNELRDIGLRRSDIERAAKGDRATDYIFGQHHGSCQVGQHSTMNEGAMEPVSPGKGSRVIALHCSGAGAGQWRPLSKALGSEFKFEAPEHYGCESTGMWSGEHAFTLSDEAARAIALIDDCDGKIHLAGHSYGGGVALHVALARSERIASLALYEPSAFHLLSHMGEAGCNALAEIKLVAQRVCKGVVSGDYRGGAAEFVDYWNGAGAWRTMAPTLQDALARWLPKAPLDFHALFSEPVLPNAYRRLSFPVLILRGEHAPLPSRLIADGLANLLPDSQQIVVAGAGHMGPLTHPDRVCELMVRHIGASIHHVPGQRIRATTSSAEAMS